MEARGVTFVVCVSQEMRISDVVAAEQHGTVPKNVKYCIGREVGTNRNAADYFSLLPNKLRVTGW